MISSEQFEANVNEWLEDHARWMKEAINPCGHHEMYFHKTRNECICCTLEAGFVSLEDALEEAFPTKWDASHVYKSARECTPGTVVWLTTANFHGVGWSVVVVKEWRGHGNGYASLVGTDGICHGQYLATDLLEVQP